MPTKEELEQKIVELKGIIETQSAELANGTSYQDLGLLVYSSLPFVAAEIDFRKGTCKCFDTGRAQPLHRFKNRKHILFFVNEPPPEVADVTGAETGNQESVDGGG